MQVVGADYPSMMPKAVLTPEAHGAVLRWFDEHGRRFPFRELTDPYAVLVVETMAQQTQIGRVSERLPAFLERFPTLRALADAAPADVIREWRGLGYNRRALNLWRAARVIVDEHGGEVPNDVAALEQLPGVGPYTARAVAAFAFGQPVAPLDVNVRRVVRRALPDGESLTDRELQVAADDTVPIGQAAGWGHALMDIGATICRAARPACDECPLRSWCASSGSAAPAVNGRPTRRAEATIAFPQTTRWLRGRLLDRLRDADGDGWMRIAGPVGSHDARAVGAALTAMAADGLIECAASDPLRARLRQG